MSKIVTQLSGLLVSLTIIFSITHEWGYFFAIDLKLLSLFTVNDYIATSLQWLPYSFFSASFSVIVLFFLENRSKAVSSLYNKFNDQKEDTAGQYVLRDASEIKRLKQQIYWYKIFKKTMLYLLIPISFIYYCGFFFINKHQIHWYIYGVLLIYLIIISTYDYKKFKMNYFIPFTLLFLFSIDVFNRGLDEGLAVFEQTQSPYNFKITDTDEQEGVFLIRALEKGFLIRKDSKITFYPASDVRYFKLEKQNIIENNNRSLNIFSKKKAAE